MTESSSSFSVEDGGHLFVAEVIEVGGDEVCCVRSRTNATELPPWLLIHGAGHDHHVWEPVALELAAAGAAVIMVDLPAHGASAGAPRRSIDDFAAWGLALLDALGLERVRLAGHSMGSLIVLAMAAAAPARCAALALLGCSVPMKVSSFLLEAAAQEPERAFALISKLSFAPAAAADAERHAVMVEDNVHRLRQQGSMVLLQDLRACDEWQGGLSAFEKLRVPLLLLGGEHDRMTPPASLAALAARCSGQQAGQLLLRTLDGAGHAMLAETPRAVARAIQEMGELAR